MKNNKKRGFTLVELLVVIAILAILATVSVVGYTSFIESANVAVDEDLASQLNHFLAAYQVKNNEKITPHNIRKITAEILELGGLDKLEPVSDGRNFYYDFANNQYVVMEDEKASNSNAAGMHFLVHAAGEPTSQFLGSSFTEGGKYFLVSTGGNKLADVINGFYSIDNNQLIDLTVLNQLVADAEALRDAQPELANFVASSAVVHQDKKYHVTTEENKYLIIPDNANQIGGTSVLLNDENKEVELPLVSGQDQPVSIPDTIEYISASNLNNNVILDMTGKTTEEVADLFVPQNDVAIEVGTENGVQVSVTVVLGDKTVTVETHIKQEGQTQVSVNVVVETGKEPIPGTFHNPASDFDMGVAEDAENKVSNKTTYAYVVYDKKTFDLNAFNFKGGVNPELPSSTYNSDIEWSIEGETHPYVKSITPDGKVVLADTAPTTACDITFIATANGTDMEPQKFVVKVVAANGLTFSFDGVDMTTRDSISLFYGKNEGSNETFSLTNVVVKYNYPENEIEGLDLADDVVFAGHESLFNANGHTLSVKSNDSNGRLAIGVKVGEYYTKTINVDLMNINALNFLEKNTNTPYVDNDRVLYVGDDNAVLLGDLFNKNQEYPAGTQVWVMNDMPEADYSLMTGVTLSRMVANAKIDLASNWNETEIQFTSNGGVAIIVVVTPDTEGNYYRISEPVRVNVVDGKNIRNWTELAGTEAATAASANTNVVFLADIVMPAAETPAARFTITGKTLYGNCFTFDIKNGVKQNYFGIITLSNATMQDLRVIGDLYPTVAIQAPDMYGTNAVHATGTSTIDNCYIANCRANVASGNEDNNAADVITIKNSVLYGGRYSNIDLRGGTLKFEGKVVAVNQPHTDNANADSIAMNDRIAGFGITVWLEAPAGTNIQNIDKLVQYNFVPETYNDVPSVGLSASSLTINADLNDLFKDIFTGRVLTCTKSEGWSHKHKDSCYSDELKYADYHFERDGVKYINPGILGEDVGDGASKLVSYIGTTLPSGDRTGYNGTAPSGYQYVSMKVETDFSLVVWTLSVEIHTYGVLNTNTELFEASENAEYIYSPWTQTAGGTEYVEYGFTNGVIIQ